VSFLNILVLFAIATTWFRAPFVRRSGSSPRGPRAVSARAASAARLARLEVAAGGAHGLGICGVVVALNFSGMTTPPRSMPGGMFATAHFFPAMYYRNVVLGTFLKGLDVRLLWREVLYFALYAAAAFALCRSLFRKRTAA
jgi:ABC-2 type transport system permease protein/ribosome-dependent ATPase